MSTSFPKAKPIRPRCYTRRRMKGAGGTPGGVGSFFLGLLMAVAGAYLLTSQVTVSSGFWGFFGRNTFGLSLLPLLLGVGLLFFDGRSIPGWLLTAAGPWSSSRGS